MNQISSEYICEMLLKIEFDIKSSELNPEEEHPDDSCALPQLTQDDEVKNEPEAQKELKQSAVVPDSPPKRKKKGGKVKQAEKAEQQSSVKDEGHPGTNALSVEESSKQLTGKAK